MQPLLIIGYGNELRGDDAAGPKVAAAFEKHPGIQVIICHQLTPELADSVSQAERVIFVDAAVGQDAVELRELSGGTAKELLAHKVDPETLLTLGETVFGRRPRAWWLTIPAARFAFGQEISDEARKGMREARAMIQEWIALNGLDPESQDREFTKHRARR